LTPFRALPPLGVEILEAGSSRGISSLFAEPDARISLERGVLLAGATRTTDGEFRRSCL
jgi:hypothetical protein